MIESARHAAGQGHKQAAIEQFKLALQLNAEIGLDPQTEADNSARRAERDEVKQEIARINSDLEGIRSTTLSMVTGQIRPPTGQTDTGEADVEKRLLQAGRDYKKAAHRNIEGKLGLLPEIARIGTRLKAIENVQKGRQLAAGGQIAEAVAIFETARKQDPAFYRYFPASEAQQVAFAHAGQADSSGQRLAAEGKISEAVEEFKLAIKIQPASFRYVPSEHAKDLAAQAARQADMTGRRLVAQGKKDEAVAFFRKAHALDADTFDYDPAVEASNEAAEGNLRQADNLLAELVARERVGINAGSEETFKKAKDMDPSLAFEPKDYVNHVRARLLVVGGQADAQARKSEDATRKFREAKELDKDLEFEPEHLANLLVGRAWLDQARYSAPTNPEGAKDALRKARAMLAGVAPHEPKRAPAIDVERQIRLYATLPAAFQTLSFSLDAAGLALCKKGSIDDAYSLYEQVCAIDPHLNVPANFWNYLCWFSSLRGAAGAKQFAFAGDLAVALDPGNVGRRDTRGLARALTGDRKGEIQDFEAYLWACANYKERKERQEWIRLLRSDTPVDQFFTPAVLKRLRQE